MVIKNKDFIKKVATLATETETAKARAAEGNNNVNVVFTQKDVKAVIKAIGEILATEMTAGNTVKAFDGIQLVGVKRAARVSRNPQTGEKVNVPAHISPKAKFTKGLKDRVAGK